MSITPWHAEEPDHTPAQRLYTYSENNGDVIVLSTKNTRDMAQVSGEWIRSDVYGDPRDACHPRDRHE